MSADPQTAPGFAALGLPAPLLQALEDVGYEAPTPIQAAIIPHLLEGADVLGQAQTGTGKTAAFALPLLSRIDLANPVPQVLVLAPTRELAIQVGEAFQRYAAHLDGFHVLPIYGGAGYDSQLRQLRRGVHVIAGTPGRVIDHIKRGTLNLDALQCLVLDEADEMLRMGFIDDVDWILGQTPAERQVALFSATMPREIRHIARTHMREPQEVTVKVRTTTADTIRQRVWIGNHMHKLDALTRILETEPFDGMIVFTRTRNTTVELAEKLEARGFSAAPLNGDIQQSQREATVNRLKQGRLDILVATDVAARGLDVERISHVVNFDVPTDTEAYVHRIGRTGRAGRSGEAILFITPRERRLLRDIERATRSPIEPMELPSNECITNKRIERFKERITETLAGGELDLFRQLVDQYAREHALPPLEIAAALARMAQGDKPLLMDHQVDTRPEPRQERPRDKQRNKRPDRDAGFQRKERPKPPPRTGLDRAERAADREAATTRLAEYRIEAGRRNDVEPRNIAGAIANETGIAGRDIGRINIFDDFSVVELPAVLPPEVYQVLQKTRVGGRPMRLRPVDGSARPVRKDKPKKAKVKKSRKKLALSGKSAKAGKSARRDD